MTLKARMRKLIERVNAFSLRERVLLLAAVCTVVFLLSDMIMMRPLGNRQEQVQVQLDEVGGRIAQLTGAIEQLVLEQTRDPDALLRERRDALNTEISRLQQRLDELNAGVVAPRQAISVLAGLLTERPGLTIVELENLPVEPLRGRNNGEIRGIFVHRVRLVVETNYAGVREYLSMIEDLPSGVYWDSLHLTVPQWPSNRVELVLFSLALDDNWLRI